MLPHFSDPTHALLSASYSYPNRTITTVIYSSSDAGQSWQFQHTYAGMPNRPGTSLGTALENSHFIHVTMRQNQIEVVGADGNRRSGTLPIPATGAYSIDEMQFGDDLHGWVHISGTQCKGFKTGCSSFTALLKTEDGGATFTPLLSHSALIGESQIGAQPLYAPNVLTNVNTYRIDTCDPMDPDNMTYLWLETNNTSIGFYLGGATAQVARCSGVTWTWIYDVECVP